MARRNSRQLRARSADLRRRQSSGMRNMGMAIIALIALVSLGGSFASGAAGCFSSVTQAPSAPLQVGAEQEAAEDPSEESRTRGVRIQVQTSPTPMGGGSDEQP